MANIVYGNELAVQIKADIKKRIDQMKQQQRRLPKLSVIIAGEDPSALSYIKSKEKACEEVGILNGLITLPQDVEEAALIDAIKQLNADDSVDGILVQLPLPKQIHEEKVLACIDPSKDVDGFQPVNLGKLLLQQKSFQPCTAKSVMPILKEIEMDYLSSKHAVVIGRSNIVGKPVAQLLLKQHATVTICHSKTADLKKFTKQADLLVVAIGRARMIDASYVKAGAVVIDVGVNRDENGKLCGDVDFASVEPLASYLTPVPKGVGPMTSVMLLENTLEAYEEREKMYGRL